MSKTKSSVMARTTRRRKQAEPLSPEMALAMLESAIAYCQQAGLKVYAANGDSGTLGLFIPNAHYVLSDDGTRAAFRLGALPSPRGDAVSIGTPSARVSARDAANIGTSSAAVSAQAA